MGELIIMKARNLQILRRKGFNVPPFIVIENEADLTPTNLFMLGEGLFAVRSSFSLEDSSQSSFAGQFKTLLNVPAERLKDAIKEVKDSLLEENVLQYCEANNINIQEQNNRIIIQEMIDAEYSGVVFTANPNGCLNEAVIVVGEGLGCNVVEDKIETTTYFYNYDDRSCKMMASNTSPVFPPGIIDTIIEIAEKIKEVFQTEMDIEYAIKNNMVYILQARPITTIKRENLIVLDNSNIVESYPGVSLPLTQDFVKDVYADIFTKLCLRLTHNPELIQDMKPYLRNMIEIANWRVYYNISNWYVVLKLLPFSNKIIPLWQEMMGVSNQNFDSPQMQIPAKTKLTVLKNFIRYLISTPAEMSRLDSRFSDRLSEYEKQIKDANSIEALLETYHQIRTEILSDWDLTLVNDMYTFIFSALAGKKNKDSLANIKNLESMKPVYSLENLIDTARKYGLDSNEYKQEKALHIMLYGDRCLCELKLETKTYRTNPELLDSYVKSNIDMPAFELSDNISTRGFYAKRAKTGIWNREKSRLNRSRIFGLCRSIFLKIGDIFVRDNLLEENSDIFYLYMSEIEQRDSCIEYKNRVINRKHTEKIQNTIHCASRLVFDGKILPIPPMDVCALETVDTLAGIGTSMGCVEGEVMVITEPSDTLDTKDKILVTISTDPGWIFLIKNAKGIIAEKGSLLSHTAIVSRELHKPAIVNARDCTKILKTGDRVRLNAYDGTIQILKEDL